MSDPNDDFAVYIDVPGITVKVKTEKCLVWLCATTLAVLSCLIVVALLMRAPVRA